MNKGLKIFLLSIALVLLQALVLNNINLFGYINPYLYITFVFLFPIKKDRIQLLTLSFIIGVGVDMFSDSGGIHTMATLSIAFIRSRIFKRIFQKPESEYELFNLKNEPLKDVVSFVFILTFMHHLILFSIINLSTENVLKHVVINTFLSTIFTLILYFLGNYIFSKEANNEA